MESSKGWAVVVDAAGSGTLLVREFRRRGLGAVNLISGPTRRPSSRDERLIGADRSIVHHGDIAATAARLARFPVVAILAGSPSGVGFAAILARQLGLPGNDPGPPCAAGEGGALPGTPPGFRFVLNGVSCRGRAWCTDAWSLAPEDDPPAGQTFPDRVLMDPADEAFAPLCAIAGKALAARGIRHGPWHLLLSGGPCGRETACLDPLADPDLSAACTGADAAELAVDACVNPEVFGRKTLGPYRLRRHARIVPIPPPRAGCTGSPPPIDGITRLPTCLYMATRTEARGGGPAGYAVLVGEDARVLEAQAEHIRSLATAGRTAGSSPGPSTTILGNGSLLSTPGRGFGDSPQDAGVKPARSRGSSSGLNLTTVRERFLARLSYHQAEGYARVLEGLGWRVRRSAGSAVFLLRTGSGVFAKMQRPQQLDPADLLELRRAEGITELVVEPAARLFLLEKGRESRLDFDPADPGPWVRRMASLGFRPAPRRYAHSKSLFLELPAGEDELLRNFAPKRRREVRLAGNEGVDYRVCPFPELDAATLAEATRLHARWAGERGAPVFDEAFLAGVRRAFGPRGCCVLASTAGALAGVFYLLLHDGVGYYYYTFIDPALAHLHLGAGGAFTAMRSAAAAGCDFFDLGAGYDERYPGACTSWRGFSFFKEQFRPAPLYHPPSLTLGDKSSQGS